MKEDNLRPYHGWKHYLVSHRFSSLVDVENPFPGRAAMKFEITLRVTTPDGEMEEREVITLDKGHDRHEDTGLSIEEGKGLLKTLQTPNRPGAGRSILRLEVRMPGLQATASQKGTRHHPLPDRFR